MTTMQKWTGKIPFLKKMFNPIVLFLSGRMTSSTQSRKQRSKGNPCLFTYVAPWFMSQPAVLSIDFYSTSDIITFDQNGHYSSSAGVEDLFNLMIPNGALYLKMNLLTYNYLECKSQRNRSVWLSGRLVWIGTLGIYDCDGEDDA